MGRSTVSGILKEICEAIWKVLMSQYVRAPSSTAEWEGVSCQFEQIWNFSHCVGTLAIGIAFWGIDIFVM